MSWALNSSWKARTASGERARARAPEVSLSSRWTTPTNGRPPWRIDRYLPARSTRVSRSRSGVGRVRSPAGLSTIRTCAVLVEDPEPAGDLAGLGPVREEARRRRRARPRGRARRRARRRGRPGRCGPPPARPVGRGRTARRPACPGGSAWRMTGPLGRVRGCGAGRAAPIRDGRPPHVLRPEAAGPVGSLRSVDEATGRRGLHDEARSQTRASSEGSGTCPGGRLGPGLVVRALGGRRDVYRRSTDRPERHRQAPEGSTDADGNARPTWTSSRASPSRPRALALGRAGAVRPQEKANRSYVTDLDPTSNASSATGSPRRSPTTC